MSESYIYIWSPRYTDGEIKSLILFIILICHFFKISWIHSSTWKCVEIFASNVNSFSISHEYRVCLGLSESTQLCRAMFAREWRLATAPTLVSIRRSALTVDILSYYIILLQLCKLNFISELKVVHWDDTFQSARCRVHWYADVMSKFAFVSLCVRQWTDIK